MVPLLRLCDAETAHALALNALTWGLAGADRTPDDPRLAVRALGLAFPNPIGLAAGFDKNAVALAPLARLGFGFVEVGTVTPRPQRGNPRPRIFRLTEDRAIVNRLGFNNGGLDAFVGRLAARRRGGVPVGANVGINKDGAVPERDYPALVAAVAPHEDYITINVSSPNTPGLRDLQGEARLRGILQAISSAVPEHPPLLVKLAPDLAAGGLAAVVETCVECGVAGLIVGNTTISRPSTLRSRHAREAGGLSGAPLKPLALRVLAEVAELARGRLTLIGVGGIATGADVLARLRAGANLVQLYTEFAYEGPALIDRLRRELLSALDGATVSNVEAVTCAR
ncbi:MAG: quinone-dependent dihydroorotate dehydrogenase [Acetobacteraceae bacterium]|nr:quinone-dependent dihydroorotate dehydrogenase [Acetobacteraceae bacterium]